MNLKPYAGRWVAVVGEQVAGVGLTPEEAVQLAQHNRPKERFALWFVDANRGEALLLSPLLGRLRPFLQQHPHPVYLVGGAVRDLLMGRAAHDLDFVVANDAVSLAFAVADALGAPAYVLDKARDTGRVVWQSEGITLDFARFRGADLTADLRDRDFTINAMALPATAVSLDELIDPCGGRADLENRRICLTHTDALIRDPVRLLRAVRQASELDFTLTEETEAAVRQAVPHLHTISNERIRDELVKVMQTAVPDRAVLALQRLNVLTAVLPDVAALIDVQQSAPHFEPVLAHTASVLAWIVKLENALFGEQLPADSTSAAVREALSPWLSGLAAHFDRTIPGGMDGSTLLRLAGLFHDVGKKQMQTVDENGRIRFIGHEEVGAVTAARCLRKLCVSNQAVDHVQMIVRHHMRLFSLLNGPGQLSRRAIYRTFRAAGSAGLDVCIHSLADYCAIHQGMGETAVFSKLLGFVSQLYQYYFEQFEQVISPPQLVNGRELMHLLDLVPGPEVGRLLRLIEEAQAAGEIHTRQEALQYARQIHAGFSI